MQPLEFLSRVRRKLALRGVIGSRADALVEEWNDHLECEVGNLVSNGHPRDESYLQACKALGEPESLADGAAEQLARGSWQGRHPWLSSGIIGVLLVFASLLGMGLVGFVLIETVAWEYLSPGTIQILVACTSTLPWILGLIWLAYYARKMPAGWKGLWIVAGFDGLVLNLPELLFSPPYNGPLTGRLSLCLAFDPVGGILKLIITFGIAYLFWRHQTRGTKLVDGEQGVS